MCVRKPREHIQRETRRSKRTRRRPEAIRFRWPVVLPQSRRRADRASLSPRRVRRGGGEPVKVGADLRKQSADIVRRSDRRGYRRVTRPRLPRLGGRPVMPDASPQSAGPDLFCPHSRQAALAPFLLFADGLLVLLLSRLTEGLVRAAAVRVGRRSRD